MTRKSHHMSTSQKFFIGFTAMAVLLATTAAVASYMTKAEMTKDAQIQKPAIARHATVHKTAPARQQYAQAQPAKPACDDSNVVGLVAGGVGGGLVGNQFGKGSGNTAATIGGVLAGAYAGGKYLPTRNATCR